MARRRIVLKDPRRFKDPANLTWERYIALQAREHARYPAERAAIPPECRFLVYRNRMETETDLLVGKREVLLRRVDGHWKVARRMIVLDQSVLLAKNLTFFFSLATAGIRRRDARVQPGPRAARHG